MNLARAAAAATLSAALLLTMGACSAAAPEVPTTSSPEAVETETAAPEETESEDAGSDDAAPTEGSPEEIFTSCTEFNTIMADLRAVDSGDSEGYEDIYFRAQDARDIAPIETYDMFTALSLWALDASLGEESQETADKMRDAAFASSGPCTEQGVTITI
jgi:hypothetical protein